MKSTYDLIENVKNKQTAHETVQKSSKEIQQSNYKDSDIRRSLTSAQKLAVSTVEWTV